VAINIGDYPEELQAMMAQMQAQGASQQSADGMSVGGGGGGFGSAMRNVVGSQTQQAGVMHGEIQNYTKAMEGDSQLNRFLYGMDQYGDSDMPEGFKEGMAVEEFGNIQMDQMGLRGVDPRGMLNWDDEDPFMV